jgi:hypothetical protein
MQHIRNNPGPGPYGNTFGATENQHEWNVAMKAKVAPEEPVFKKINATWPIRKQQRERIQSLVFTLLMLRNILTYATQMSEPMIDERHFLLQSPTKSLGTRQQKAAKSPVVPEMELGKRMPLPAPDSYSLRDYTAK